MKTEEPKKILLKDYQKPDFSVEQVDLAFDLFEDHCQVTSLLKIHKLNSHVKNLFLDGEELKLLKLELNEKNLSEKSFLKTEQGLEVFEVPENFDLRIVVRIEPQKNTSLEGLYKASGLFCTQCEPQGFRKITYYLDRPDVMSRFTVDIEADATKYPVLLSNGNLLEKRKLENGRHRVRWQDPFKKPAYLFALVAGDLGLIEDQFITASGKSVKLQVYAQHGSQNRCHHAMESLKKSMAWDESRFGREYDLSTYMIVAADDFNAGAMENKGLNIFNSRLVLADEKSATDNDYFQIESVIAHEYFHNWTGNRVTLRDWFHLSLKEGLTVFRDQEFSMDMSSRSVVRIDSVNDLRSRQFAEDAGPSAHPIRPESCLAVDNFFTATIYEKGSEVIRMMQTMVGRPGFRKGMDLYFERHDGQAVIIEDFAKAISDANSQVWDQFKLWYSQAGTPQVKVTESFDSQKKIYSLKLEQSCPPSPGQEHKKAFHIPLVVGLLGSDGTELELINPELVTNTEGQKILHFKETKKTYQFSGVSQRPALSINRQFSAPIRLDWSPSNEDLLLLLKYDTDDFNRWEAGQKLATDCLLELTQAAKTDQSKSVSQALLEAFESVSKGNLDPAMKAMILELPEDAYLLQLQPQLNAPAMESARRKLEKSIAQHLRAPLLEIYKKFHGKNNQGRSPLDFAHRRLKNLALFYLSIEDQGKLARAQFDSATIMTDQQAALACLCRIPGQDREQSLQKFYDQWKHESLVLNKWFALQAQSSAGDTFERVVGLWNHPDFNLKNPNRVYSLLLQFGNNLVRFHDPEKLTYDFLAEKILELDHLNPQVATRVASCFNTWTKLHDPQKTKARHSLESLISKKLSKNTFEIVSKALDAEK